MPDDLKGMPYVAATAAGPDHDAQGRDALAPAVRLVLALGGAGFTLTVAAIIVRAVSLSLDPATAAAAMQTAWYGDPVELAFLGARSLITYPTVLLVALWLLLPPLFRPHMARARIRPRMRAFIKANEDRERRARTIFAEFLKVHPSKSVKDDAQRLLAEAAEGTEEIRAIGTVIDENPLPSDERDYPVRAFGLLFASWRVFIGFLLAVTYVVATSILVVGFPIGFVELLASIAVAWLVLAAAIGHGTLRSTPAVAAIAVAVVVAITASVLAFRLPVGMYEWSASSGLEEGRYALIARGEMMYVVPCSGATEVIALRALELVSVRLEPTEPRTWRSLWAAISSGDWPGIGPLTDCRSG